MTITLWCIRPLFELILTVAPASRSGVFSEVPWRDRVRSSSTATFTPAAMRRFRASNIARSVSANAMM